MFSIPLIRLLSLQSSTTSSGMQLLLPPSSLNHFSGGSVSKAKVPLHSSSGAENDLRTADRLFPMLVETLILILLPIGLNPSLSWIENET
mmetsp:Transcript_34680/g.54333  ORF Transcript_34680/g.54333 Transcript_34680/m.54333 type:complete len:90 (-) Transcript_34680:60-329(-)